MYSCLNCGAGLRYDPERQMLVCDYCGSELSPQEYREKCPHTAEESSYEEPAEDGSSYKVYIYTCPQCGGELMTTEETAATFCSFCGGSVILESRMSREHKPDYVIPFVQTREDCKQAYKRTLRRALFAPSSMLRDEEVEKFRGIYMPYWVYGFERHGGVNARGETSTRKGDFIYTKHYNVHTDLDADYEGISFDASSSFSDSLSEAIAPFDFSAVQDFQPAYLSGFYADTNDVSRTVYEEDAKELAREYTADQLGRDSTFAAHGVSRTNLENCVALRDKPVKLGMFPVWFLSIRNKHDDRVSYAVVNGQTGKVAVDLPIDFKKYLLGSLILAMPIFAILTMFLTLTPTRVLICALVMGIISLFICNRQLNLAYSRENKYDDQGYMSLKDYWNKEKPDKKKTSAEMGDTLKGSWWVILIVLFVIEGATGFGLFPMIFVIVLVISIICILTSKKRRNNERVLAAAKAPAEEKIGTLWKSISAIILAAVILFISPVSDLFYYAGDMVVMVLVLISFRDIVKAHNRLTMRKLPQFERRGGDDHGIM